MIPTTVVNAFLNRKLGDCRSYKNLTVEQLEDLKNQLPVKPPIWERLRTHQKVCLLLGVKYKRFAFWADTGTGKTLLSISLAHYFKKAGVARNILVLVPNKINKQEWLREIEKHCPQTTRKALVGSSAQKWEELERHNTLLTVATYAGLVRMVCESVKARKGKSQLQPQPKLVQFLTSHFDGLVMDESTCVQSKASLMFRVCRQIAKQAKVVFALSGTPFGRDPTPLWAQMFLIDAGETLGPTLTLFRAAFFTTTINYWGGYEHTFKRKLKPLLHQVLANRSIRYEADQASLPRYVPIIKEVRLPKDAVLYIDEAKKAIIQSKGNYREMKNAFLRMRQISSGFLGYYDDETGDKAKFFFDRNPKLEMLMSIIESIQYKIVVIHEFLPSGAMIEQQLKERDIGYSRVFGGTKDHAEQLHRFDHDPNCRVFITNVVHGLNLQVAKYIIFFESPLTPSMRTQAQRRVERQESKHKTVFGYDLVVRGTADANILAFLREGRDLFAGIIDGIV